MFAKRLVQIMGILQDPVMQSILQQAKTDPAALQEHMKNAGIRCELFSSKFLNALLVMRTTDKRLQVQNFEAGSSGCYPNPLIEQDSTDIEGA